MKPLILITIFSTALLLTACQSEVDKCVDAVVKAQGSATTDALQARARLACLSAQGGKK